MSAASKVSMSAEPNITPMIDVLLVLLIIFLMAIPQMRTIDATLPQPCLDCGAGSATIVLEVLPGPTYRLNQTTVATSELLRHLATVYRDRPEKIIQVAGYPGVRYSDVVSAMDIAKSAGVRVIGIAPKSSYLHSR